jgi:DNA-binding response OmpR family regulator
VGSNGRLLGLVVSRVAEEVTVTPRILVVEDEEHTRTLFGDIIRHLGYEPALARSAETARVAIESDAPDIILLDVRLPLMSGYEFLRLRAIQDSHIPIVAVSGSATESDARSCLHFGALDFLGKPVALDLLRAVLHYAAVRAREGRSPGPGNRRRSPRPAVAFPVEVVEHEGPARSGVCVDLSTFGIRLHLREPITTEPAVRLHFTPNDGGAALALLAPLVRRDGADYAFRFVNLTEVDFRRLTGYVRQLTN